MSGQPSGGPDWLPPEWNKTPVAGGTPRFGALSHHSFFSRHNPHPSRVRHIQGLNGKPVCSVRDDWLVSSSLFPHPLLKNHVQNHVQRPAGAPLFAFTPRQAHYGSKAAIFSEAWRDELRELAAKVTLSSQAQEGKHEEEPVRRQTQYSAQTGRLVPPTAKSHPRRPHSQRPDHHRAFHDQELTVLELLCQILQTDSLQALQRWLLTAGRREKELVTAMIQQVDLSGRRPPDPDRLLASGPSSFRPPWRTAQRARSCQTNRTSGGDEPETVGDAEVLEIRGSTGSPR
ncbi:protein TBATA [Vanacampus margaritifer]